MYTFFSWFGVSLVVLKDHYVLMEFFLFHILPREGFEQAIDDISCNIVDNFENKE
jgi:hypothetical protein